MPDELHVCLGDTADLIQAKLDDYKATMDARMARLIEDLAELRARVEQIEHVQVLTDWVEVQSE